MKKLTPTQKLALAEAQREHLQAITAYDAACKKSYDNASAIAKAHDRLARALSELQTVRAEIAIDNL